ncbi:MAG: type III-B CRISPR-associated protein Cas10/Cmr2 [Thermodesulfobacteriota bacterium]
MPINWNDLLLAYLHDPPDKALDIKGHLSRAEKCASVAIGRQVDRAEFKKWEDQLASAYERLPTPSPGDKYQWAVGPRNGHLMVRHPLSGQERHLDIGASRISVESTIVESTIEDLVAGQADPRHRFLLLWRMLPERLGAPFNQLPADTRTPDHTIWHHLDITAGLTAASNDRAFLSFHLGPVQSFIAAARTVRDLWTGSAILSWLTFQAMLPIIEELGPTAMVFPALRGSPLMDLWLHKNNCLPEEKPKEPAPCLPNRFLALVPWGKDGGQALDLAQRCEDKAREGWRRLADRVREKVDASPRRLCQDWDRRWDEQIGSFFEFRTAVWPWGAANEQEMAALMAGNGKTITDAFPDAGKVRSLADTIPRSDRPGYQQDQAGLWQARVELAGRLMEAQRSVRHVPAVQVQTPVPGKCGLMGSYEQMGPDDLKESAEFWKQACEINLDGVRLGKRERLCAVALAKRFAVPALLSEELGLSDGKRFPDTATVAAAVWLQAAGIDPQEVRSSGKAWSGQWLHWRRADQDKDEEPAPEEFWKSLKAAKKKHGAPPAYYAVLAMDADQMGKWLRGENAPTIRESYHPKMIEYFSGLPNGSELLNARRPVGPAMHAAISEALTNFAVHVVPHIVAKHQGTLIYAGGDDVLALLPARCAPACAHELYLAFRGDPTVNNGAAEGFYRHGGRELLMMGPKATLSAGVAVVHYKEDLRLALEVARRAEKRAKESGRDAWQIEIMRRSGDHSALLCLWPEVQELVELMRAFGKGASDRWTYRLRALAPTLSALPQEAVQAEIKRQVNRGEDESRKLLGEDKARSAGEIMAGKYKGFIGQFEGRESQLRDGLAEFVAFCQSAAFLVRGRDR